MLKSTLRPDVRPHGYRGLQADWLKSSSLQAIVRTVYRRAPAGLVGGALSCNALSKKIREMPMFPGHLEMLVLAIAFAMNYWTYPGILFLCFAS